MFWTLSLNILFFTACCPQSETHSASCYYSTQILWNPVFYLCLWASFFCVLGFLLTLLTCDCLLESYVCRQPAVPGIDVPCHRHSPEPSASECICGNRKAQPLCLWLAQTLKCNLYYRGPFRGQAGDWLCLKSHLCLAVPSSLSSLLRVCLWNPRLAFTDLLSIKKSLTWEQAIFCFTYTFSHSRNCL